MLIRTLIVGILIALAAPLAFAAKPSKPPSPQPSQQQSAQDERGTEKSPAIVKILPPEKSQIDLDREKAKDESDRRLVDLTGDLALYTKLLFGATAVLVLVTAGLVCVGFLQVRDAKEAIAAAVKSATAADKAASAAEQQTAIVADQNDTIRKQHEVGRLQFFAAHRPKLIVRKIRLEPYRGGDPLSIVYVVANVGTSDATITEHSTLIAIEQEKFDGTAPNLPFRSAVKNTLAVGFIIKPGEHIGVRCGSPGFKYDEGWKIETPPLRPIFVGCVRYEDGLGNKRRTEFHRSYDRVTGRFSVSRDPDEEYTDE